MLPHHVAVRVIGAALVGPAGTSGAALLQAVTRAVLAVLVVGSAVVQALQGRTIDPALLVMSTAVLALYFPAVSAELAAARGPIVAPVASSSPDPADPMGAANG